jgi:phosphoserine phosphatase
MNLVLTPTDPAALTQVLPSLVELTGAGTMTNLDSGAVRLEGVLHDALVREQVDLACAAPRIDHAFVDDGLALADYRLLVMDMDSTFITIECIDEIADMCGLKAQVAAITEATMRGEIADFAESLKRRVALLEGLDASALQRVYDERLRLSPGAEKMLAAVRRTGLRTLLVSGGFTFFTERLKERYGLDYARSNTLEIVDGKLTGRVLGDIVDAAGKARAVEEISERIGATTPHAIALGDGANDLKMMALAGIGIAYHAKPVVRARAKQSIRYGGLDVLLDWFVDGHASAK